MSLLVLVVFHRVVSSNYSVVVVVVIVVSVLVMLLRHLASCLAKHSRRRKTSFLKSENDATTNRQQAEQTNNKTNKLTHTRAQLLLSRKTVLYWSGILRTKAAQTQKTGRPPKRAQTVRGLQRNGGALRTGRTRIVCSRSAMQSLQARCNNSTQLDEE